ncbi:hypothetical protein C8F04DRAFT_1154134 [Mycena alexandri]|uniref:Uncharacterized protein n=1 Tax=Mycena alexandri TaxID=1745969 RepID=A0AAD6RZ79_9AGAR|nr:hypothetical protein C8F04DRAFT_1154134 [Mycena alexandri]
MRLTAVAWEPAPSTTLGLTVVVWASPLPLRLLTFHQQSPISKTTTAPPAAPPAMAPTLVERWVASLNKDIHQQSNVSE